MSSDTENNVVQIDPAPIQRVMNVPDISGTLIQQAIASNNIEVIERVVAMVERRENRARLEAYNKAMALAKAKIPRIIKDRIAQFDHKVGGGRTSYSYAELATVCRAVDQPLSEHGLYYRWRTETPSNEPIRVGCIVYHELGHSEENWLSGMPDASGSKNPIQAMVSSVTYMKRDTLCSALGIAAGRDDDAQAAGAKADVTPIAAEDADVIKREITRLGISLDTFYQVMTKHAGYDITKIEDLHATHVAYCKRQFSEFEQHQKRQQKAPSK